MRPRRRRSSPRLTATRGGVVGPVSLVTLEDGCEGSNEWSVRSRRVDGRRNWEGREPMDWAIWQPNQHMSALDRTMEGPKSTDFYSV
jgi:hypothetical protein